MKNMMFVRQPIFDSRQNTCAYELLYRCDMADISHGESTTPESSDMLNRFGLNLVANNHPVFVKLSRQCLLGELPTIFPADRTVLEIGGDIAADDDVMKSVQAWKHKGFRFALAHVTDVNAQLLPFADFVKVDLPMHQNELEIWVQKLRHYPVKLLAHNVETYEQYKACEKVGFDYFQGCFFCKPSTMTSQHALGANKTQALQLLSQVLAAHSPQELEYDISHDLALSYQLLRYINSASTELKAKINSVGHALAMLGLNNIRIWISMLLVSSLSKDNVDALLFTAFCRGRFLERLAASQDNEQQSNDYFVLGMFSLLDALLNQDIDQIMQSISLPNLVHDGIFNHASEPAIRLKIIRTMEGGDWIQLESLLHAAELDDENIASIYAEAVEWADEKISAISSIHE